MSVIYPARRAPASALEPRPRPMRYESLMASKRAAIFDMDRTLVRTNTGLRYVRWRVRQKKLSLYHLAHALLWSALYALGAVPIRAVSRLAASTLVGEDERPFALECEAWVRASVVPLVTTAARAELERMRAEGYVLAVLSGSSIYTVEPLARSLGIPHALATRLAVEGGRFTGDVLSPLAFGEGKVELAERWAEEQGVDLTASVFYSDSISDLPMLERVGEARVVNPDLRLRWAAFRRKWRVDRW